MKDTKIDENLYSERSLNLLNIRELREIGRKFAVPSPTTMKKDDLINYILNVVYGKVVPPKRSAYGRPTIHEFDIKKYISKIKKNADIIDELKDVRLDYADTGGGFDYSLKLAMPKEKSHTGKIIQRTVCIDNGIFYLREKQFIKSKNDIEIDDFLAKKLNLENFDIVELIVSDIGIKIISKNGERINSKFNSFKINDEIISDGTNKVFHLRTKEEINKNIELIKNECLKQNIQFMLIKTDSFTEFQTDYVLNENDESKKYKQFMMFVEKCKQFVYENKNIFVVVDERNIIENMIESFDNDIAERIKDNLKNLIDEFLKLSNNIVSFNLIKSRNY